MTDSASAQIQPGSDDPEYRKNLIRASLASSVGSALEYYDFALYGLSAALIFGTLFFPELDPSTRLIASLATFGVGFVARPLGGLFFGVLGDKLGRKWVLVVTILLMGGASTAVGLLPTYNSIGVWAPVLLVLMRLLQGFGAGAEQAGSTVLMAEYSPVKRRGFFSALPFIGIQAGTLLASAVFLGISTLSDEVLLGWVWRIPFLVSILLILVALFIRLRLRETPTFIQLEEREQVAQNPLSELVHNSLGTVVRGIGLRMAENGGSYMFSTLAAAFIASQAVGLGKSTGSLAVAVGSLLAMITCPLAGAISDRLGRVKVYRFGAFFLLVYSFPAWWLLSLGIGWLAVVVVAIGIGVGIQAMLGPQCALLPEMFGSSHRYLGVAVSREFSAIAAGGLAGVIGATLLKVFNDSWVPVAGYMALLAAITAFTTFFVVETKGRDLLKVEDSARDPQLTEPPRGA
ncbi:MAG: MHS family MFS transporter [Microlunatus sp.]|nr:MHS family MFS transporter [Microlunatus sp.]MDN5804405.1 MHS family MFS transporter [Microlunatus sp.]